MPQLPHLWDSSEQSPGGGVGSDHGAASDGGIGRGAGAGPGDITIDGCTPPTKRSRH